MSARAEESATVPGSAPAQEWIGVELMGVSLGLGSDVRGTPERVQYGAGATIRLLRRRWSSFYVTPVEAGFYVTPEHGATLLHAMVEAGYVAPGRLHALELGLGAGVGILALEIPGAICDGSCDLGGAGALLSPVVRYRIVERPRWTLGAALRGVLPLHVPSGEWLGHFVGRGAMVVAALDVGFGSLR